MSSPFKTAEFLALKDKWYSKLKNSGFQDAEQDEDHMRQWVNTYFMYHYHRTVFDARQDYYRLAGHFLHDHKFKNKTDFFVWSQHAAGATIPSIKEKLLKKGVKVQLAKVHAIIHRLAKEMIENNNAR